MVPLLSTSKISKHSLILLISSTFKPFVTNCAGSNSDFGGAYTGAGGYYYAGFPLLAILKKIIYLN